MSRKIVQIAIAPPIGNTTSYVVLALANDGTLWKKIEGRGDKNARPWVEISGLPEAVSDEDFDEMINNPINR